jgi:hypothetical protein
VPGKLLADLTGGTCALDQLDYELAYASKWVSVSKEYALLAAAARHVALQSTSAAAERSWSARGRQFSASRAGMAVSTGMQAVHVAPGICA